MIVIPWWLLIGILVLGGAYFYQYIGWWIVPILLLSVSRDFWFPPFWNWIRGR